MVIESDFKKSEQDDSKIELFVNTSAFTDEDFKTYLNICEKIQYNEQTRRSMRRGRSPSAMLTATMTREEIFECSTLDEDGFLSALEHQNSYKAPPLRELNLTQSMNEAMHYFDEDVVVDSGSSTAHSPVKQQSKVSNILNSFKGQKGNSTPSPTPRRQEWTPVIETSSKIKELRKQYEAVESKVSPKKQKSPKTLRKSMVKQLASLFNSKVAKIEQPNNTKTRAVRVSYRPQLIPSPVHSPRSKRKLGTKTHCLVAEHVFKQLSVKDKASLFNKYSNADSSNNSDQLNKHQESKQTKSRRRFARGEVINEKQEPVKELTQKLEAKSIVLQQSSAVTGNAKNNSSYNGAKLANGCNHNNGKPKTRETQELQKLSVTKQNFGNVTADEGFVDRSVGEETVSNVTNVSSRPKMSSDIKQMLNVKPEFIPVDTLEATTTKPITDSVEEAYEHGTDASNFSKLGSNANFGAMFNKALKCELIKIAKPKRKKKLRRILMWKPDLYMVEAQPVQSTDTESECNLVEVTASVQVENLSNPVTNNVNKTNIKHYKPIFDALDESKGRHMGTSLKMGASHSLSTGFSEQLISGVYGSVLTETSYHELSRSCPSLVETSLQAERFEVKEENKSVTQLSTQMNTPENQLFTTTQTVKLSATQVSTQPTTEPVIQLPSSPSQKIPPATQLSTPVTKLSQTSVSRKLINSYIDQGFETGSNNLNATLNISAANESKEHIKSESALLTMLANDMAESSKTKEKYPSGFSTPVKGHLQPGTVDDALEKLDFSPILVTPTNSSTGTPSKCSAVDIRSSIEEHLTVHRENSPILLSRVKHCAALPKHATRQNSLNAEDIEKTTSIFWINTGDFCVSLDIYHNNAERLSLLYDIFSQKSYETRDIAFGIDEQMYFAQDSIEFGNIRAHFPSINNCSHYWFASGDMTLPFMGKYMLPEKIQRLFNIVREAVAESGTLRFGVDRFDFSRAHEVMYSKTYIHTTSPMTSPNRISPTSINSNSIRTSDLDRSEFDSEASADFPLSTTSLSNNYSGSISMDSAHFTLPQNDLMISDCASLNYEEEHSLNQIFEDAIDHRSGHNEANAKWLSKPLSMLQTQQQKLKAVEQRIHCYSNSIDLNPLTNELEVLKDTPDYVCDLQEIIAAIIDIGQVTGFKNCSLHQLESFTYFLSHYADICLDSCLEHMDRILEALKEKRGLEI